MIALVLVLDALPPDVGGNHGELGAHLYCQRALRRRGRQLAEFSALVLNFGRSEVKPTFETITVDFWIYRKKLDEDD